MTAFSENRVSVRTDNPMPFSKIDVYSRSMIDPDHAMTVLLKNLVEGCFDEAESACTVILLHERQKEGVRLAEMERQKRYLTSKQNILTAFL